MYQVVRDIVLEKQGVKLYSFPKDYFRKSQYGCRSDYLLLKLQDGEIHLDRVIMECFDLGKDLHPLFFTRYVELPFCEVEFDNFLSVLFGNEKRFFLHEEIQNYLKICSFMMADEKLYQIQNLNFDIIKLKEGLKKDYGPDPKEFPLSQDLIFYLFSE